MRSAADQVQHVHVALIRRHGIEHSRADRRIARLLEHGRPVLHGQPLPTKLQGHVRGKNSCLPRSPLQFPPDGHVQRLPGPRLGRDHRAADELPSALAKIFNGIRVVPGNRNRVHPNPPALRSPPSSVSTCPVTHAASAEAR